MEWRTAGGGGDPAATLAVERGGLRLRCGRQCPCGATLDLGRRPVEADAINIASGASLVVRGTCAIEGDLNIDGTASVLAGAFSVTGSVVNNGTLRLTGLSTLTAAGEFTNNGVLDLLSSNAALPAGFTNNGTVILNSERRILSGLKSGVGFTVTVMGHPGHTYQLQRTDTFTGAWTNVGTAQSGAGTTLTFTDPGGATGPARFYRIAVSP